MSKQLVTLHDDPFGPEKVELSLPGDLLPLELFKLVKAQLTREDHTANGRFVGPYDLGSFADNLRCVQLRGTPL